MLWSHWITDCLKLFDMRATQSTHSYCFTQTSDGCLVGKWDFMNFAVKFLYFWRSICIPQPSGWRTWHISPMCLSNLTSSTYHFRGRSDTSWKCMTKLKDSQKSSNYGRGNIMTETWAVSHYLMPILSSLILPGVQRSNWCKHICPNPAWISASIHWRKVRKTGLGEQTHSLWVRAATTFL